MHSRFLSLVLVCSSLFLGVTVAPVFAQTPITNFTLSSPSQTVVVGRTATTVLGIQLASGKRVTGADVWLTYDPTIIRIPSFMFQSGAEMFTQTQVGQASPLGFIKVSSTNTQAGTYFSTTSTGSTPFGQFLVEGLKAGQTTVRFQCSQGATNDSNIVEYATGNDLLTCASLPSMTVTVVNPTPTPSPTPLPTPVPTPTPTPAVIPVCLTISTDIAVPKYGDTVRFTCGQISGATSYGFRYRVVGANASGTIPTMSTNSNISQPFVISKVGAYDVECQVCVGSVCSPYTAW